MLQSLALTYSYNNYTPPSSSSSATSAGANIALLICGIVFVAFCILFGLTVMWKIFTKAGRPGWAALVPFYNFWVLAEIAGQPGWRTLFIFVPFAGGIIYFVLYIVICIELAKRFGKSPWFALMLIIPPLPLIGFTMLAYGKSQYQGNDPERWDVTQSGERQKPPRGLVQ